MENGTHGISQAAHTRSYIGNLGERTAQRGSDSLKANDTEGEWLLIFRDPHLSSTQDYHWGGYAILLTLTDHPESSRKEGSQMCVTRVSKG